MELGQRIRAARLQKGLSQRQLCGDTITRNMLSQIEGGSARPSMDTLSFLAGQLGLPVSWFLEEDAVVSVNIQVMADARAALAQGQGETAMETLADFREPDEIFREEMLLLKFYACLQRGRTAMEQERFAYASAALEQALVLQGLYITELLRAQLYPMLENCFRQLGDFRKAYQYACMGK